MGGDTKDSAKASVMNWVFIGFVAAAVLFGAFTGRMKEVTDASFSSAKDAVTLALGLVGVMAFWLGMMRVLEAGGFVNTIARIVRPIMVRLFRDVPENHPAMGAMVMNISANMLGLGNAATPFGIRAMTELNRLNSLPGTATNAMCLFLAINTSSVTILPLGVIGVRAAAGSTYPASIFLPTLFAHTFGTIAGVTVALLLERRDRRYREEVAAARGSNVGGTVDGGVEAEGEKPASHDHLLYNASRWGRLIGRLLLGAFVWALVTQIVALPSDTRFRFLWNDFFSFWLMPLLVLLIVVYGLGRGVKVYEAVTEGAKQGFDTAVRIIPFLVTILVAIGMFRASGAMDLLARALAPVTGLIGLPPEAVPMVLIRPLSGSGAFGIMGAIVNEAPDSYEAYVASVLMGASDTTFYILAVYFGAVGVVRMRHALAAGLAADITGAISASLLSRFFWTPVS